MKTLKFLAVVLMGWVIAFGLFLPWSHSHAPSIVSITSLAVGAFVAGAVHAKGGMWVGLGIGLGNGVSVCVVLSAIATGARMPAWSFMHAQFALGLAFDTIVAMASGEVGSRSRVLWERRRHQFRNSESS